MARKEKFTLDEVRSALEQSGGIFTGAAQLLKCAPNTIKGYVRRHKSLQTYLEDIEEMNLDVAESALLRAMASGEGWAVIWYLRCKGKKRGYTPNQAVTVANPDGSPIQRGGDTVVNIFEIPDNGRGRAAA